MDYPPPPLISPASSARLCLSLPPPEFHFQNGANIQSVLFIFNNLFHPSFSFSFFLSFFLFFFALLSLSLGFICLGFLGGISRRFTNRAKKKYINIYLYVCLFFVVVVLLRGGSNIDNISTWCATFQFLFGFFFLTPWPRLFRLIYAFSGRTLNL